ncbi:MAG: hypothetical protein KDD64_08470, partial [Bdellovibrionales bacterium]|nr:hypothetical protein [Bdellovibrionales bacterium]
LGAEKSWVTELAKYQIEHNSTPHELGEGSLLRDRQFGLLQYRFLCQQARALGLSVLPTGGLITADREHLSLNYLTGGASGRYARATEHTRSLRGPKWAIAIPSPSGEPISFEVDSVMSVGLTCSNQIHIQCDPLDFCAAYNNLIALSGALLAPCVGSPLVFGNVAQKESRISQYEQAWDQNRVFFSDGFISHPAEPFQANLDASRFIPCFTEFNPEIAKTRKSDLLALNIQNGSIHRWIRPVFGNFDRQPHLRLEYRPIPISPSMSDTHANKAYVIGVCMGALSRYGDLGKSCDFGSARESFYDAARSGMESKVWTPASSRRSHCGEVREELLELADHGLEACGVDGQERSAILSPIRERLLGQITEADWQIRSFLQLKERLDGDIREAQQLLAKALIVCGERDICVSQRPSVEELIQIFDSELCDEANR